MVIHIKYTYIFSVTTGVKMIKSIQLIKSDTEKLFLLLLKYIYIKDLVLNEAFHLLSQSSSLAQ